MSTEVSANVSAASAKCRQMARHPSATQTDSLTLALTALMRQDKFIPASGAKVIVGGDFETAIAAAEALRTEGTAAVLDTTGMSEEELDDYAKARGIETIMYMNGGEA